MRASVLLEAIRSSIVAIVRSSNEQSFGEDHPNVAIRLNNLAKLLKDTNRLAEAEPLMRRALEIFEKSLGPDHPNTQTVRRNLEILK